MVGGPELVEADTVRLEELHAGSIAAAQMAAMKTDARFIAPLLAGQQIGWRDRPDQEKRTACWHSAA